MAVFAVDTIPRGQRLAVWTEGYARNAALAHGQWRGRQPLTPRRVPQHDTSFVAAAGVSRGQGAIGTEGQAHNVALVHMQERPEFRTGDQRAEEGAPALE